MSVPSFILTCTDRSLKARTAYEVAFSRPAELQFRPGQFVLFDVPHPDAPDDIQTRAFSIASAPQEDRLRFLITLKQTGTAEDGSPLLGRASRWVSEQLHTGMQVRIQGPFGTFCLRESDRPLLFIATGSGIAPFYSMARHLSETADTRDIDIVCCMRSEEDLLWQDEWRQLEQAHPNLQYHQMLSRPSNTWNGLQGRVQQRTPELIANLPERDVYICGNPDMTKDVKTLALHTWGVPKEFVHAEGYI